MVAYSEQHVIAGREWAPNAPFPDGERAEWPVVNLLLTMEAQHLLYTMVPRIWFEGAIDRSTWGRAEGSWGLQGVA
jgi:hypothetical protein